MLLVASLAPFVALANTVAANPIVVRDSPISLSLARYINATGAAGDLVRRDRERARSFVKQGNILNSELASSVEVTDAGNFYTASVGVGTPPTYYNLVIDTGSSITWVGAQTPYVGTNTSMKTSNSVSVTYGTASFSGTEYTDTVTIEPGSAISQQGIGVASTSAGFRGVDGILGIGPVNLTIGALQPARNISVPTVTDNLFKSGAISSNVVSVSFQPTTATFVKNGELTFGEVDPTKFTGPMTYAPLTTISPANRFWGVNQSIQYDASVRILDNSAGIVDTGTTLILLASDAFDRYRNATGAVMDPETQLLSITPAQFANLKSLFFTIGGSTFEFTPNAQIWPRALNGFLRGSTDSIYLVVNEIGTPAGAGLDFINGYTFLERFYTVFDTTNRRVGFATTSFTMANSN